jgi:N-acetylmuramoyl-L-alanine amidase
MQTEIVIDPGHGGAQQRGNSSPEGTRFGNNELERHVNFALAQRVANQLGGALLTRGENENRALGERIALARSRGARAFVSLHSSPGGPSASAVWVHPRAGAQSLQLAEMIRAQLTPAYGGGAPVSRGELAVLNPDHHDPGTAACLVELGYGGGGQGLDPAASAIARAASNFLSAGGQLKKGRRYPLTRAQAQEDAPDRERAIRDPAKSYFEIVEDNTAPVPPRTPTATATGYDRGLEGSPVDTIVNVAKAAWDVMKDNQPVANATSDFANAIPSGAGLTDVAGWDPTARTMRLHYHSGNVIDINTTDIYLTISWYFNGAWNGVGQYVNAATVLATGDVAWGNKVNVTASINSPMNAGTRTAPIGALPIRIKLTESNIFQDRNLGWDGLIEGNGAGHIGQVG